MAGFGARPYHCISAGAANQDSQVVLARAGSILGISVANSNAAVRYVKIYDKATAPTSSDTPIKTLIAPPGGGNNPAVPHGIAVANGIAIRITTGLADNDTGAAGSGEVSVDLEYV